MGGTGREEALALAIDPGGNAVVAGRFEGTVDFDPGPGVTAYTATVNLDTFLAKYSPSGAMVWAKALGYGVPGDLAVASDGSIFLVYETLNPTPGTFLHRVLKVNSSGNAVWQRDVVSNAYISATGIALGSDGSIVTSGFFQGTADFDPGAGVVSRTSAGGYDAFIAKLSAAGDYIWACTLGASGDDSAGDIAVDGSGSVHVAGHFSGTVDFDPGSGQTLLTSAGYEDAFVWKLNANGTLAWARQLGGGPSEYAQAVAVDASGNVYSAGYFWGDGDFDPGPGSALLHSAGASDVYVSKLDAAGNYVWARSMGGSGEDRCVALALDAARNVFATGYFQATADFDPSGSAFPLASAGAEDVFVSKLDQNGNFIAAAGMGGAGSDQGLNLAVDGTGNVVTVGLFSGSADFDPGSGALTLTSHGGTDAFVSKLTDAVANGDIRLQQVTANGQLNLSVTYQIAGAAVNPFDLGLYRSSDTVFTSADEPLRVLHITDAADLTVGQHTKVFRIGSSSTRATLPGVGAAETDADYYVLAVADPANALDEGDAHPYTEDNTAVFFGVYHAPGGAVFVHGTAVDDSLTVSSGGLRLNLNGTALNYEGSDVTGLRVRGHDGNDLLTFTYGSGFGTAGPLPCFFEGGAGGNRATVRGSAGNDIAVVAPGLTTFSGAGFDLRVSHAARVTLYGQGGNDTASLYDSTGADTLVAKPTYVSMTGRGFTHQLYAFAEGIAYATYGTDTASLYDSAGDDTFKATATYGRILGAGFSLTASRFDAVTAYASDGTDTAQLYDSAGNDLLKASPTYGQLSGPGFSNLAKGFDSVYAYASDGTDSAYLYDSAGNDLFRGTPTYAYLSGTGFYSYVKGFDAVTATASEGSDTAYLFDSAGNDALQGTPEGTFLRGRGFSNKAIGFDKIVASASGGSNTGTLSDTSGDDYLKAADNWVHLYKRVGSLRLVQQLVGFQQVTVTRSTGVDVKNIAAGLTTVNAVGQWIPELTLPAASAVPCTALEAMLSEPLGSTSGVSARFTDGRYFTVEVPIDLDAADSARLVVPPLIQSSTGNIAAGSVDVALVQGGQVVAAAVTKLEILDLLPSTLPAGSVALGYLQGALREAQTQRTALRQTSLDTEENNAALLATIGRLTTLIGQIQGVISNPTQSFSLGTMGGRELTVNTGALAGMDRLLRSLIAAEAALEVPGGKALGLLPLKDEGDNPITAAGAVASALGSGVQPDEALWDRFHNVGRTALASIDPQIYNTASKYLMGAGTVVLGAGVAGAAVNMAAGAGLVVALGAASPLWITGGILFSLGAAVKAAHTYASSPDDFQQALDRIKQSIQTAEEYVHTIGLRAEGEIRQFLDGQHGSLTGVRSTPYTPQKAVRVQARNGVETTENFGPGVELDVWLTAPPTGDVTVNCTIDDTTEGMFTAGQQLLFPMNNWKIVQQVLVVGVDDSEPDGIQFYSVTATASGGSYDGLSGSQTLVNLDDEPYLTISIDDTEALEGPKGGGGQAIFLVTLSRLWDFPVEFQYHTVDGTAQAGVDYQAIDWTTKTIPAGSLGTTVTVQLIGNDVDQPDRHFYVTITPLTENVGSEPEGLATIRDDDVAGFSVNPSSGLQTTEAGGTASFSVALTSEPADSKGTVTVTLSSSDTTEGTVQPTTLVFSATNWRTAQTVTVRGVDDTAVDGNVPYVIRASSTSIDPNYNRPSAFEVGVTNLDNDQQSVGRFDGSYTGGYSGTATVPGYGTFPVSGPVAATVNNGVITVTQPEPGSGSVDAAGNANFSSAGGSVGNATFQGTFVVQGDGSVYASGTWVADLGGGGSGSGTWWATRPPLPKGAAEDAVLADAWAGEQPAVLAAWDAAISLATAPRRTNAHLASDALLANELFWYAPDA